MSAYHFSKKSLLLLLPQVVNEGRDLFIGPESALIEGIVMNYFVFGADVSGLGPCNGISNDHCIIDLQFIGNVQKIFQTTASLTAKQMFVSSPQTALF